MLIFLNFKIFYVIIALEFYKKEGQYEKNKNKR